MSTSSDLSDLKKKRSNLKAKFTKFINFLNKDENHNKQTEIKIRVEGVRNVLDNFEMIQDEINALKNEGSDEFDQFEKLYYETISRATDIINKNSAPISNNGEGVNKEVKCGAKVYFPKIEIIKFDGSYDKWLDFESSFRSLVHENSELTDLQKLHFLRSSLLDSALSTITAVESTSKNYSVAWELLNDEYNNKRVIIQSHIRAIMDMPGMNREFSQDLKRVIDVIRAHLRSLKTLGEPLDSWDSLLIQIVTAKLDRKTHTEWEKSMVTRDMPKFDAFLKFLTQRHQNLDAIKRNIDQPSTVNAYNKIERSTNNATNLKRVFHATKGPIGCVVCKGLHKLYACERFKNMTLKDRLNCVKSANLCFNCLNTGHRSELCSWKGCKRCGQKHNTMLHDDQKSKGQFVQGETQNTANLENPVKAFHASTSSQVLLSTALIYVKDCNDKMVQARVLLDSGSQAHMMTKEFADLLNLRQRKIDMPVTVLDAIETRVKQLVSVTIHSRDKTYTDELDFLIVSRICDELPNNFVRKVDIDIPLNVDLADPDFNLPRPVDAIIGNELCYSLLCMQQIDIPGQRAVLQKTKLGWIVAGKIGQDRASVHPKCMLNNVSLDKEISRFWEVEEIQDKVFLSEEQFQVEEHFRQTTTRDPSTGRYVVRMPFNNQIKCLSESREIVKRQFLALERRLDQNIKLKTEYINHMRESIELGHMKEIDENEIKKNHCFLPHHPVFKESSTTTKMRVVYNASAKTTSGISLNDCLKVGAVVQNTSFDISIRFRLHQVVIVADIEKMYKQIRLHNDDQQYQLVLWRENNTANIKTYVIPVVLFGCASAPHTATRVLKQLADDEGSRYPVASRVLKNDCYVDDVISGADDVKSAIQLRDQLIKMINSAGFTLRKWCSNRSEIMESLPEEKIDMSLLNNNSNTSTLGITWNRVKDKILYNVSRFKFNKVISKRVILSEIAQLYDPIGLIGPVLINAKMIMQEVWQCGVNWDEAVPLPIQRKWLKFCKELPALNELEFNRRVIQEFPIRTEIHGFCDASEKAYGACIYVRSINIKGKLETNLLCSKNRVAPLKTISLPKLELCAALLLCRLTKIVCNAIENKINDICLWTDSSIVLQWINTEPCKLNTFVANRVSEIRENMSPSQWKHVRSADNAADVLSRGQLAECFVQNEAWKTGPKWLAMDVEYWPRDSVTPVSLLELKPTKVFSQVISENQGFSNYSNFKKLKRITAYVLRFVNNCSKLKSKLHDRLSLDELNAAEIFILKEVQQEGFKDDILDLRKNESVKSNSQIRALNPFIDRDGLIRVGGRLRNSILSFTEKHPILLPKNHHITILILRETHIANLHGGTQSTLNAVRAKYWQINGKITVKNLIRKCVACFRAKPRDSAYFMGDLPDTRVTPSRPFLNSGVDYCGPFYIKEKKFRNRVKVKSYVCVFVCFTTKAVHFELITDLTSEAFIAGLRRFFARRGSVLNLYSDNGTNFIGAKNSLESLAKLLENDTDWENVSQFFTLNGVNWHFSPPGSPHFGGIWEAAVKSFKNHFIRTVGDKLFTYEEFLTYVTEIEAVLNSRPITPLSDDPNDLRPLTPAHFLIGESFTHLPDYDYAATNPNRLSSWQHIQFIKQHFWKRWSKEYLHNLVTRAKWQLKPASSIKIGTMVLLKEENAKPLHWPIGRITEVFPGKDGVVRVVSVKTNAGLYKRSVTRIAPLPIE